MGRERTRTGGAALTERDLTICRLLAHLGAAPVRMLQQRLWASDGTARNRFAVLRRAGVVATERVGVGGRCAAFVVLGPEGMRIARGRGWPVPDRGEVVRALVHPTRTAALADAYLTALKLSADATVQVRPPEGPAAAVALLRAAGREVALCCPDEACGLQALVRDLTALAEWAAGGEGRRAVMIVPAAALRRALAERLAPVAKGEGWRRVRVVSAPAQAVAWALGREG